MERKFRDTNILSRSHYPFTRGSEQQLELSRQIFRTSWMNPAIIVEALVSRLSEFASSSAIPGKLQKEIQAILNDLEEMAETCQRVGAVIAEAKERHGQDRSVREWVQDLRDWTYDVYKVLLWFDKMRKGDWRGEQLCIDFVLSASFRQELANLIRKIKQRFWEIARRRDALRLTNLDGNKPFVDPFTDRQPCGSLPSYPAFVGKEDELQQLCNQLHNDGNKNIGVIAIIGMGGIGKTAVAQKLYNETASFKTKAWVSVSEKFDVAHLLKATIESFTRKPCGLGEVSALQEELRLFLQMEDEPVLLVLDDLWNENSQNWETFIAPFRHGAEKGSKILITTRLEEVARKSGAVNPIRLNSLSEDEGLALLQAHAFSDGDIHEEMKGFGKRIVRKCAGLPLAIKVLGFLLRSKGIDREESWKEVLQSSLLDYEGDKDAKALLGSLHLSFIHLTPKLKDCFQICGTYAKQNLTVGDLKIFLKSSEIAKDAKDADLCIEELRSRSFLETSYGGRSGCITMHDLMYDLARYVFGDMHLRGKYGRSSFMDPLTSNMYSSPLVAAGI